MNRRAAWIVLSTYLILSLVLAGCAGATPQPTQPSAQPTAIPQPTQPPAPTVAGDLIYVLPSDIASFDPHNTRETVSGQVNSQMFDYLTVLTPDGTVAPGLAESWETSSDGLTWTFHLRQGVSFHDGTPFNAEAVKANLDRILNKENALPAATLLRGVTQVEVVDDNTLQLVTQNPFGPLPYHLTHYSLGIISLAALESMTAEELAQKPIGTGPFVFQSYTPNESIVLTANPDYWGTVPTISTVTFKPVPEAASRAVLLETGEAHIVANIAPQDVTSLQSAQGVKVDVMPFTRVIFVHMNEAKPPFDNVLVRQALSYAIDRQTIVDNVLKGFAALATGPLGSGVFGYAKTEPYPYDPARAIELLTEAGYPNGFTTKLWVPAGRYQGAEEAAQVVQAQLAEVGVRVEIEVKEFSALLTEVRKGPEDNPYEMLLLGFAPATNDADWQLYSQFHSSSFAPTSNNRSFYSNPEVDKLLEQGRFSTDPGERQKIYAQILDIIREEAPELYLYQATQIYGVRENVDGVVYLPIDIQDLETVKINQ